MDRSAAISASTDWGRGVLAVQGFRAQAPPSSRTTRAAAAPNASRLAGRRCAGCEGIDSGDGDGDGCVAGDSTFTGAAASSLTGASNRYPTRGSVLMNSGPLSPRAARSSAMHCDSESSVTTKPGQTLSSNSSLLTARPAWVTRCLSSENVFGRKATGAPSRVSSARFRSRVNGPKCRRGAGDLALTAVSMADEAPVSAAFGKGSVNVQPNFRPDRSDLSRLVPCALQCNRRLRHHGSTTLRRKQT